MCEHLHHFKISYTICTAQHVKAGIIISRAHCKETVIAITKIQSGIYMSGHLVLVLGIKSISVDSLLELFKIKPCQTDLFQK